MENHRALLFCPPAAPATFHEERRWVLSGDVHHDKTMKSRRFEQALVWTSAGLQKEPDDRRVVGLLPFCAPRQSAKEKSKEKDIAGPVTDARSSSHPARCRDPAAVEQAFGATRNESKSTRPLRTRHALQSLVDRSATKMVSHDRTRRYEQTYGKRGCLGRLGAGWVRRLDRCRITKRLTGAPAGLSSSLD